MYRSIKWIGMPNLICRMPSTVHIMNKTEISLFMCLIVIRLRIILAKTMACTLTKNVFNLLGAPTVLVSPV